MAMPPLLPIPPVNFVFILIACPMSWTERVSRERIEGRFYPGRGVPANALDPEPVLLPVEAALTELW